MMGKGHGGGRKVIPAPGWSPTPSSLTSGHGPVTQAVYYRDASGREPVDEFIDSLTSVDAQDEIDDTIDLLNGLPEAAPPLAFPYSSQVRGELRELRCHYGKTHYRILYRRSGNLFVLLHAVEKHSTALAEGDIRLAKERFNDFRRRMDANPRVPPRAAGHDAPGKR